MIITEFFTQHQAQLTSLFSKLLEHLYYAGVAMAIAIAIGIPLGLIITRMPKLRGFILGLVNIFQTLPSLAVLAFLIPFLGIGSKPTLVALVLYALLPIVQNTYIGLSRIPASCLEAAQSLRFNQRQLLWYIEFPLAMPVMIAGIRTATAMTIGLTTIAAFIGAGGLGDFITQGLALNNTTLILLGAIPTALLALALDATLARIQKSVNFKEYKSQLKRSVAIALVILLFAVMACSIWLSPTKQATITIASKNFTEQYILSEIMAQLIEEKTDIHVVRKFNLGSTAMVHAAMVKGDIDLYPEYTGTGLSVVLKEDKVINGASSFNHVKLQYEELFNITWLAPFGFENAQALAITPRMHEKYQINSISDLSQHAAQLRVGAPAAFIKRPDALPLLQRVYGLQFKSIAQVMPDLIYRGIQRGEVDLILSFTTDPRIEANNLVLLVDDKNVFPKYDAAPVIRQDILVKQPELTKILGLLAGKIDAESMRAMNAVAESGKQTPAEIAKDFLKEHKLIP